MFQDEPPAPLTPPDCDLRSYPFMPLMISRLRRSKAWLKAKRRPELGFYMVNLWSAAWHDFPAGSLEDDDDVLADLAMCDPGKWLKLREFVMHGWVKCSDGRLYHPVVCEQANECWEGRQAYRSRLQKARDAKALKAGTTTDPVIEAATERIGDDDSSIIEPVIGPAEDLPQATAQVLKVQGKEEDKESKQPRARLFGGLEECVIQCEGRPSVGGFFLDSTRDQVYEDARIDLARWEGDERPLIKWLNDGIEPSTIRKAIQKRVAEKGDSYEVPRSLGYFDIPVRRAHASLPKAPH
jgi:hypothetical protein